jgi:SAM-dependent methyltransferase
MTDQAGPAQCTLCGHAPLRPYAMARDARRALHVAQWECTACRLLSSHPRASAELIAEYYSDDYYGRVWPDPEHVWRQNLVAYRTEISLLDKMVPASSGTALDVGCGYGVLTHLLNERGYDAIGCEMGRPALAYCRRRGLRVVRGMAPYLPFADASFDLVVSFHVIEHVLDPVAFVNALGRVLKPGGAIVIVTDHRWTMQYACQRWTSRIRGRIPPFFTSTDHTFVFAPEHVERLLHGAGCHGVKAAAFTHVSPGEHWHWRAYKGLFRTLDRWRGWGDYMMVVGHKPAAAGTARAA